MTGRRRDVDPRGPARDAALLAEAALWVALARLAVRLLPFSRVRRLVEAVPRGRGGGGDPRRATAAVRLASRILPGRDGCLPRAVAADALLRRRGRAARLEIGVRRGAAGRLEAHAWVSCDGLVVLGDGPDRGSFRPLRPADRGAGA